MNILKGWRKLPVLTLIRAGDLYSYVPCADRKEWFPAKLIGERVPSGAGARRAVYIRRIRSTEHTRVWLYWWWVFESTGPGGPFIKSTHSSLRLTSKQVQQHDIDNGWSLGRVHRLQVPVEKPKRST